MRGTSSLFFPFFLFPRALCEYNLCPGEMVTMRSLSHSRRLFSRTISCRASSMTPVFLRLAQAQVGSRPGRGFHASAVREGIRSQVLKDVGEG